MAATTHNNLDSQIKSAACDPRNLSAEYENSIPLDYLKRSGADEINAVAEHLLSIVGSQFDFISGLKGRRLKTAREKMFFHIKLIIINLLVCSKIEASHKNRFYISYSRNKNDYSKKYKQICSDFDYLYMISAVDALAKYGFIENKKGFFDRRTGCGRQSRMRAEERFIKIFQNVKPDISNIYREHPLIFLRNENGDKIDASKNTRLHGMAKNIRKINEMLISAKIELHLDELQYSKLITRCHVDASFKTVYRVFNNDFNHGGRLYGHWVQNLPREYRAHLTVDGNPVVELDYSSIHPRILYRNSGTTWPSGDLYAIPGVDSKHRKFVKIFMNAIINAKSEDAAINSMFYSKDRAQTPAVLFSISHDETRYILSMIKKYHAAISQYFGSGIGLRLQKQDSDIAFDIMLLLWEKGIRCIPIHDSFIVAYIYAKDLLAAMQSVSARHLGQPLPVAIKHGRKHLEAHVASLFT